ncbi:MAG: hypothetical protein AAFX06_00355, partial [Planctomycetota bacterium]
MRLLFLLWIGSTVVADESVFQITDSGTGEKECRASGTLLLTTDFGRAFIEIDKVDEIRFAETSTLTVRDGTVLRGELDWSEVIFTPSHETENRKQWKTLQAIRRAEPEPNKTTMGRAGNRLSYYIHAPESYSPDTTWPALVLLHGSNMNAKSYIDSVRTRWPELSETHLLIGINGERRNPSGSVKSPTFNYTYVNFAGKSKY